MDRFETRAICVSVRRSVRSRAAVTALTLLVSAVLLLIATEAWGGSDLTISSGLPPDHPVGTKATVALVSFKRAFYLQEPSLSIFIVDYLPGGSAVLHRSPAAGYVLVHVLSGEIRAQAWRAGMGTYRSGQTWVEPAIASDIITTNASTVEPARALVVLMTDETRALKPKDHRPTTGAYESDFLNPSVSDTRRTLQTKRPDGSGSQ